MNPCIQAPKRPHDEASAIAKDPLQPCAEPVRSKVLLMAGLCLVAFAISPLPCFATDPPPEPKVFPPQVWTPTPAKPLPLPLPAIPVFYQRNQLDSLPISPTLYRALLSSFGNLSSGNMTSQGLGVSSARAVGGSSPADVSVTNAFLQRKHLLPLMASDPPASDATQSDSAHEAGECTLIVHPQFDRDIRADIDTAIVPFVHYATPNTNNAPSSARVAMSSDFSTWYVSTPPIVSPYNQTGDPVISSNVFSDTSILNARRIYIAGTSFNGANGRR
jgi:hypothetical protein